MGPRRIAPSFLLRLGVLSVIVGVAYLCVRLLGGIPRLVGLGLLALLWLLEENFAVLARLIARRATSGASIRGRDLESIWFVDRDADRRRARQRHLTDTEDNPTIR